VWSCTTNLKIQQSKADGKSSLVGISNGRSDLVKEDMATSHIHESVGKNILNEDQKLKQISSEHKEFKTHSLARSYLDTDAKRSLAVSNAPRKKMRTNKTATKGLQGGAVEDDPDRIQVILSICNLIKQLRPEDSIISERYEQDEMNSINTQDLFYLPLHRFSLD
jgi:hypothetical protein